jgi:hypothetical protein
MIVSRIMSRSGLVRGAWGCSVLVAMALGCGAPTRASKPPQGKRAQSAREQQEPNPTPARPSEDPAAKSSQAESAQVEEQDDRQARDIRYHVMPEGLRVTVAGVSLLPKATAVKLPDGWGVRMTVLLNAEDGKPHVLLSPDPGPLSIFARIIRHGKQATSSEPRRGDGQQFITPGDPLEVAQEWPGGSAVKPLTAGDELELEVGLWGIGSSATSHRPLKKFFRVKMAVNKGTPRPLVSPPEMP